MLKEEWDGRFIAKPYLVSPGLWLLAQLSPRSAMGMLLSSENRVEGSAVNGTAPCFNHCKGEPAEKNEARLSSSRASTYVISTPRLLRMNLIDPCRKPLVATDIL